jgi:deoxyadenosine/deoxycytidine kinase
MELNYRYIAVEGNIGAGKTTLSRLIAEKYGASLILEQFEHNEFLPKFYANPDRYAFPLELSFLAERYQQLKEIQSNSNLFQSLTVSDYFLSKSLIFARINLTEEEYKLFWQLFDIMFQSIPKPDLLIYLYSPIEKLQDNIRKRGRVYEQKIDAGYLEKIQSQYLEFLNKNAKQLKVLLINMNDRDFVNNHSDLKTILNTIELQSLDRIQTLYF